MAMEDKIEDVAGLEIKPPSGGRPSQAGQGSGIPGVVGMGESLTPPTPTEQREAAQARAKEEGVRSAPVESTERKKIHPPPPNAAKTVATIAQRLEDGLTAAAERIAELEAENRKLVDENNAAGAELDAYYREYGKAP